MSRKRYSMKMDRLMIIWMLLLSAILSPQAHAATEPQLQSESAILIDATTGEILYEKNATSTMYPASITKIVTGIIALEQGDVADLVTVSEKARHVIGTRVYLEPGEQVTLLKLIHGLMLNSGNDAAVAIAEHLDGDVEQFAQRMNRFVQETVGVADSHFTNPHGLYEPGHYTTAYDMARIAQYAMNNDDFREIVGLNELEWVGESWETTIYNHNRMIRQYEGATGIKNGYVTQAGHTLVASAKRGDTEFIGVTLKAGSADQAYRDMTNLLDYAFDHFETVRIEQGSVFLDDWMNAYIVNEDLFYTSKKDEAIAYQLNEAGVLSVLGSTERIYLQARLSPAADPDAELFDVMVHDPDNVKERKNTGTWVFILIVLAFIYLFDRRRRRRRARRLNADPRR
jgi:D-alanyl-D-alanine carboxypeptidase